MLLCMARQAPSQDRVKCPALGPCPGDQGWIMAFSPPLKPSRGSPANHWPSPRTSRIPTQKPPRGWTTRKSRPAPHAPRRCCPVVCGCRHWPPPPAGIWGGPPGRGDSPAASAKEHDPRHDERDTDMQPGTAPFPPSLVHSDWSSGVPQAHRGGGELQPQRLLGALEGKQHVVVAATAARDEHPFTSAIHQILPRLQQGDQGGGGALGIKPLRVGRGRGARCHAHCMPAQLAGPLPSTDRMPDPFPPAHASMPGMPPKRTSPGCSVFQTCSHLSEYCCGV